MLVLTSVLAACGNTPTPVVVTPDPVTPVAVSTTSTAVHVDLTVGDQPIPTWTPAGNTVLLVDPGGQTLARATLTADGKATLRLPAEGDAVLKSSLFPAKLDGTATPGCSYTRFTASVSSFNGTGGHWVIQAPTSTGYYGADDENADSSSSRQLTYVDRDVDEQSDETCAQGGRTDTYHTSVHLLKGWNVVVLTDGGGTSTEPAYSHTTTSEPSTNATSSFELSSTYIAPAPVN